MDTSNRIQTYAVAGLVVLGIALLPILYRAMRSGSQSSLDALVLASALLTAVGVIVLASQFGSVLSQFAKQPEREALYLSEVTAHDGGPYSPFEHLRHAEGSRLPRLDGLPHFGDGQLVALHERNERINDAKRARAFASDPIDYVDDLPFLRSEGAQRLHSMVGADGYLDLDNAAPCDLAWFYGDDSEQQP